MQQLGYGMWDADNHLYESRDAFTRHLPDHRKRDLFWVTDERGHEHIIVNGKLWDYIPNPTFDPISLAGSLTDMFSGEKSKAQVHMDGFKVVEPLSLRPEYQNRDKRIERLDQQGIEACILFPTAVSGLEEWTRDDVKLTFDLLWAFNRWLEEEWGFAYRGRMHATPVISLADPDEAVRMLDWVLERGARAIDLRSAPVPTAKGYRSPGDPIFDAFWARAAESGILVCVHAGESGYYRYSGDYTGRYEFKPFRTTAFEHIYHHGRPIMDFFAAMVCHGAITRHPSLRLVSVENGSDWVAWLVNLFKLYYQRYPGSFPEDPVTAFERCVWISPFWEEDLTSLTEYVPVERLLAGSDYPHAEGLSEPTDFIKGLTAFSEGDARAIMRDNLKSILAG
ncbi:putative TIM-barrel fold metal-dependent hydrolase [Streptosporangium album]|uniref:Putative TIM-barrel fold metal-dependent hydrolase n=1 Tax=Streptosporangium album TaxID=47479 RepID=A0A7W7S5E0_9ACTN|nr:amidohydrolase family protein [Streptosporangium album]MBB4944193.1 putative TIM-barrel fold metal-dependent hydrolase [Streptosporangium album]